MIQSYPILNCYYTKAETILQWFLEGSENFEACGFGEFFRLLQLKKYEFLQNLNDLDEQD